MSRDDTGQRRPCPASGHTPDDASLHAHRERLAATGVAVVGVLARQGPSLPDGLPRMSGPAKKTPITAAIGYPRCTNCGALKDDPCRTPSGETRFPHDERNATARYSGIPLWDAE